MGRVQGTMMRAGWTASWPLTAFWIVLQFIVWGLVIAGLVLGGRWLWRETGHRPAGTAMEILRTRYARGEVSRGEFDAMKREIERARV